MSAITYKSIYGNEVFGPSENQEGLLFHPQLFSMAAAISAISASPRRRAGRFNLPPEVRLQDGFFQRRRDLHFSDETFNRLSIFGSFLASNTPRFVAIPAYAP